MNVPSISREFSGADFNDRRLERRLESIAAAIGAGPEKSFPKLSPTPAALRATYRFMNHSRVTPDRIIAPHREKAVARAREVGLMLAIHDTTQLEFSGDDEREGLGFIRSDHDQGFSLHCTLAVAGDGSRRPLGVIAHRTWVRSKRKPKRRRGAETFKDPQRESLRWTAQVEEVEALVGSVPTIHVADREADAYTFLQNVTTHEYRFVIRMRVDRVLVDDDGDRDGLASEAIERGNWNLSLSVPLSRRGGRPLPGLANKSPRKERTAKLAVKTSRLRFKAPVYMPADQREPIEVNVVHAMELDAPDGQEPVSWVLLTSEPVDTAEQALFVLDVYRTRWLIEELFKALKSGCAIQKRQLESYDALANALAVFLPVAWQLLLLRNLHRNEPTEPAALALTPTQIDVLRARLPKLMPPDPTIDHALRAVAWLAGHFVKTPPGWQTLGLGLERLLDFEQGWLLAKKSLERCV